MTTKQLNEIRERCEKATAGPWAYFANSGMIDTIDGVGIGQVFDNPDTGMEGIHDEPSYHNGVIGQVFDNPDTGMEGIHDEPSYHNGVMFAHARQDIPALLNHIEALTKAAKKMEEALVEITRAHNSKENAMVAHKALTEWRKVKGEA